MWMTSAFKIVIVHNFTFRRQKFALLCEISLFLIFRWWSFTECLCCVQIVQSFNKCMMCSRELVCNEPEYL